MKRYDVFVDMVDCEDGEWVRYDEAAAEIERLRAENERLRRALRNASRELSPVRRQAPQYIYDDLLHDAAGGGNKEA